MSMMESLGVFSVPVLVATFALFVVFLFHQKFSKKRFRLPPGPRGLPFFGNFLTLAFSKIEQRHLVDKWAQEYGDVFMFTVFGSRFVVLSEIGVAKETYLEQDIHGRAPILPCNKALDRPNTSLGLVGSDDRHGWKDLRKLVHNVLRNVKYSDANYEYLVTSQAQRFLDEVSRHKGSYFDLQEGICVTVANVTNNIVSGKTYDYDDTEFVHLTGLIRDVFEYLALGSFNYHVPIMAALPLEINRRGDVAIKGMFDFIADKIKRNRATYDGSDDPTNFIETFLREQRMGQKRGDAAPFDDANLIQIIWDLYIGGFETVSTSLYWYFLIIAQHPDVQARVHAELDQVVGRDRMPNTDDRSRMPFTESTMTECYRISGMIPNTIPHRAESDCRIKGYDIPEGSFLTINLHWLALSPNYWDKPDEFRPERFVNEAGDFDSRLEAKLAEFGIGRRNCVGEQLARTELFIIFTHVLHRFTLKLPDGTPISMAGINGLTYQPLPYKLLATPRF